MVTVLTSASHFDLGIIAEPYWVGFAVVFLRSMTIFGGINLIAMCIFQYALNYYYLIDLDQISIQVGSLVVTVMSYLLRCAVGWPLLVFGNTRARIPTFDFQKGQMQVFIGYGLPIYGALFGIPCECLYLWTLARRQKRRELARRLK